MPIDVLIYVLMAVTVLAIFLGLSGRRVRRKTMDRHQ